mgnify:CR=1 FL=1
MLTTIVKNIANGHLVINPTSETHLPEPKDGEKYMLYLHVPFCEVLCPYCSFNRYKMREDVARRYFENMRKEMLMLVDLGYDFETLYFGGGTPTILLDELCKTIDLARDKFPSVNEVAVETNPNHLTQPWLSELKGRVQRMSVGVQSFDDNLLKQMDRYNKYGSGAQIMERIGEALPYFDSLNVDMIFNFPSQTEEILARDIEMIKKCGCRQTTFSPLYVSSCTTKKMAEKLGKMDYNREFGMYKMLDEGLTGGQNPVFKRETVWTFNRLNENGVQDIELPAEEVQTSYDEYPSIGSGSISHLNGGVYVNTFSLEEYNKTIESGRMSIMGKTHFSKHDRMRYRFMMQLFGLRLDKKQFKEDFGCSIEAGLPAEMAFMTAAGAFATNNDEEITLTPKGRYLMVVMMRQFFIGVNNLRDQARAALPGEEKELLFGC